MLLITGNPGSGKTTVIRRVAAALSNRRLGGFYTEEIRVRGERRGFRLATFDGQERVMAHVEFRGPHRVGKYGVDVSVIDGLAESALALRDEVEIYLVAPCSTRGSRWSRRSPGRAAASSRRSRSEGTWRSGK